ncbi:MAG: helix-turn-helix domain-containing protein, partial [Bacteroidota bacterium]
ELRSPVSRWLVIVFLANVMIGGFYNIALYGLLPVYIFGPLFFSFLFYALSYFVWRSKNAKQIFSQEAFAKYANRSISETDANDQLIRLDRLMQEQQLYKNPRLKLKDVANALALSSHQLSQLLNEKLGQSFPTYINERRVAAACALLGRSDHLTMEGVGYEVGFSSKSSFYATFKKLKGMTPAQFDTQQRTAQTPDQP